MCTKIVHKTHIKIIKRVFASNCYKQEFLPGAVWTMIRTGQFFLKRETILETNRSPGHGITWYYMVLHGITWYYTLCN